MATTATQQHPLSISSAPAGRDIPSLSRGIALFDFKWQRDWDYVLDGDVIRRRSSTPQEMDTYRPDDIGKDGKEPPIHHQFVDAYDQSGVLTVAAHALKGKPLAGTDREKVFGEWIQRQIPRTLQFVKKFGFLGSIGGQPDALEEPLRYILLEQQKLWAFVQLTMRPAAGSTITDSQAKPFNEQVQPHMTIGLVREDPGVWAIQVRPRTLISYMWLRVAQEIAGGVQYRQCANSHCSSGRFPVRLRQGKPREFCEVTGAACRKAVERHPEWDRRKQKPTTKGRKS